MTKHHNEQFGRVGEEWVAQKLRSMGFKVQEIGKNHARYDLIVNGCLAVEVKSAYQTVRVVSEYKYKRWLFTFRRNQLLNEAEMYVLLCFEPSGEETEAGDVICSFVIPDVAMPPKLTAINITKADPRE